MPTEAPNTLRSRAKFNIVDIISQGPIKGLFNGAKSIYLDETPVQNEDGTYNFPNFDVSRDLQELPVTVPSGSNTPIYPGLFPASENEVSVATKVTKNSPEGSGSGDGSVTRTITDSNLDALRITMRVPALTNTNTTTGDITGGTIRFNIYVKPNGGVFAPISAGSQWEGLPAYNSETDDGATGIEVTATYPGSTPSAAITGTFQYRKKTGGVWGDWITFGTATIPRQTPSSDKRGYYNNYMGAQTFTRSVTNLTPGIYQAQVVSNKGITGTSARQFIENALEIQGKTVSAYDASYLVNLPDGGAPWDVKVVRVSDDNIAANIQDDLYWYSYTEITDNRFSWPNIAGTRLSIDAESFGGNVPNRAYDVMGLLVQVPSNYDPYERTYTGIWNGTFKTDWTDNPAWIFYDLLTNKRYGLGDNIDAAQIDKYALYQIAQYCDELVDAPNGEQEPRYTCSCVINTQSEAYELLTAIASAFRGMIYHSGGMITPVADMPSDPVLNVGPANVIDGTFTYQGASRKARHTVARVSWNNPDDGYKLNVELYEDTEAIRRYGYRPVDINAFGCTSRGLARRWGKWSIVSDNDAPDTVTYKAGFDHFKLRPGDVINIADPNYSGEQLFGLIADVTDNVSPATHTITLDRAVTRIAGDTSELQLTLADGTILALDVAVLANTTSAEITVDSSELTTVPLAGASWLLKKGTVEPRQWRVISISEDEPHIYQVTAMLYDPNKYDSIETGLNFAEADFTAFPSGPMPAPTSVAQSEFLKQTGSAILACVNLSWTRPSDPRADLFEVQYQLDGEEWRQTEPNLTQFTGVDIINIVPGVYNFRVRAQDTSGLFRSAWTTLASQTLLGKDKEPEDVTGFTAIIEKYGVLLNWSPVSDIDINYYEIRMGGTDWDDATFVGRTAGTTYKYEDQTTATLTFRIKARDTNDNWSINATSENSTGETQNVPTVTTISIPIGIQVDIAGELKRGFSHWELRRRVYSTQVVSVINARITTRIYFDEAYDDLVFGEAYEYSARAVDTNNVASAWSAYSSPVFPLQIQSNDITADQIVAKDFRTAQDVGATVDGVKFTADGIEMWEDGIRKVFIPVTGDPEFYGLLTAAAGHIGGWEIFPTYLQSNNIRLDSAGLLQTLDFVSGHKGWKINQDGNAEFNNLRARGAIKTVVFEKDEISVVGGRTLIRPAGVVKDYDYTEFINAAANVYLEECWDKLNELLGTSDTYVAAVFADYDEYAAAELAYYNELSVAMGFNQFTCAILEADYDDATKNAYLTACWAQLMTLLDLTTATPAIPSMTFAAYKTLENGYFAEVAEAIDNPPLFMPYLSANETAIETDNADQFKVGDIVRVKDGLANDYWGRISAISGNILSITGESGEPFAITAGQTIVNYGIPGSGGILLDGQAPLMDVYTHSGEPWLGTDIRLRIGNLNGWGTINDNIYGIAIGQPDGEYLIYDSTSGRLRLNGAIQISQGTGYANLSDKPTNLSGINSTEGSKLGGIADGADVTAANTAYDTARVAGETALTVKNNAANALANAATANNLLADIAADNKLVASEKQEIRREWDIIADEKAGINAQAVTFGITTENTNYNNAFQGLANYLNNGEAWVSGVPSWIADANLGLTQDIVGATFRSTWKSYYDTRTALLNAISVKAKDLADAAQGTANTVTTRVNNTLDSNNRLITAVIPTTAVTPAGAGLFLGSNFLGYHSGSAWRTYMDNNGNFALIGAGTHGLGWNAATGVLTIAGSITIIGGSGYDNLTDKPTSLADVNSTEGSKLTGIEAGADVTSTHTSADTTKVAGTAAATVRDNAANALANAATAQSTANAAVSSAATANGLLADIASDNKLTPDEKQSTKKEWDIIVSEKTKNDTQADAFSVSKTAYGVAYTTLSDYITPLLSDLTATSNITGTTFRTNFKNYYDARTDILNAIAAKAKTLADAAQGTANTAVSNAATAQGTANAAAASALSANNLLADIAADDKLVPSEKQATRKEWDVIAAEKAGINAQSTTFGIITENTTYNNAFQALANYLNAGTTWTTGVPSWIADANLATTTDITGSTFRSTWKTYYDTRTALLNAIAAKAKTLADTAQSTANNAASAAATAQTTANTAVTNAATANGLLANIAADNKFVPSEKQATRKEWDIIAAERPVNSTHAMSIAGFTIGIAEGSFNEAASDAYWSECWTKLNTLLGESNAEPAFPAQTFAAFSAEEAGYYTMVRQVIDSEPITVPPTPDVLALNTTYIAAFQALATYLNAGSTWSTGIPSWIADANISATTDITGSTFRSTWKAYYDARTALLNAIAAKSKALADLAKGTADSVSLRVDTTLDRNNRVTTAVIPKSAVAPTSAGLFLGSNYLGYHNGSDWKTYMDANGNFALAGTTGNHGLTWNSATNVLTVAGTVNATSGNIAGFTLATTDLTAGANTTAIGISTDTSKKAFWAGSTTPASAPFSVGHDGAISATSGTIGGFSVSSSEIFVSGTSGGGYGGKVRLNATTGDIGCQYAYFVNSSNNGSFSVVLNMSGLESNRSETISGTTYTDKMQFRPTSGNIYDNAPLHIQLATSSYYAFYTNANVYIGNNCSALSFTDRTEMPESMEEALEIINTMQPINGKVDYKRLSKKAKKSVLQKNIDGTEYVEDGRDLTKTVSALVMACQKLLADNSELVRRIEYLEKDKRNEK